MYRQIKDLTEASKPSRSAGTASFTQSRPISPLPPAKKLQLETSDVTAANPMPTLQPRGAEASPGTSHPPIQADFQSQPQSGEFFNCNYCELAFPSGIELSRHYRDIHDPLPYMCMYCSKTFTSDKERKEHIEVEHKTFCHVCWKSILTRNLREHLRRKHNKVG